MRNELKGLLVIKCERLGCELKSDDTELMFGMYVNSEKDFKLMRGDRLLLKEIAENLSNKFSSDGLEAFVQHFQAPMRYKISKVNTDTFDFGVFYSEKRRQRSKNLSCLSKDELKASCFDKVRILFESYPKLKPVRAIAGDIVRIVDANPGYRADIVCVFCVENDCDIEPLLKTYSITIERGNWCTSNLRKHVSRKHCKADSTSSNGILFPAPEKPPKVDVSTNQKMMDSSAVFDELESMHRNSTPLKSNQSVIIIQSPAVNLCQNLSQKIMAMPIILNDTKLDSNDLNTTKNDESLNCIFYDQFSAQNLKMIESGLTNKETIKCMPISIDNQFHDINVVDVNQNGNCMFAAIVHQLESVKCNSQEHNVLTAQLRAEVVQHIKLNIDKYKRIIKLRDDRDDDEACTNFLNDLSCDSYWGGMETMLAVMEMHRINIIIFNEEGPFYYANGFNRGYERSIFMAYRLRSDSKKVYNHYDTVHSLDENVLYKCAEYFSERMKQ